jgi:hypothetical protein
MKIAEKFPVSKAQKFFIPCLALILLESPSFFPADRVAFISSIAFRLWLHCAIGLLKFF